MTDLREVQICKRGLDCENCGGEMKVLGGVPSFPQIKFKCTSCTNGKQCSGVDVVDCRDTACAGMGYYDDGSICDTCRGSLKVCRVCGLALAK